MQESSESLRILGIGWGLHVIFLSLIVAAVVIFIGCISNKRQMLVISMLCYVIHVYDPLFLPPYR